MRNVVQKLARAILCVGAIASSSTSLAASDNFGINVGARVRPYCQVIQQQSQVSLANGAALIGPITEVCNAANGYRITASFANLVAGTVTAGEDVGQIADDGTLVFERTQARKIRQEWLLSDAVVRDGQAPVSLQVNVSPL